MGLTTDKDLLMAMVNRPQVFARSDCKEFNEPEYVHQASIRGHKEAIVTFAVGI